MAQIPSYPMADMPPAVPNDEDDQTQIDPSELNESEVDEANLDGGMVENDDGSVTILDEEDKETATGEDQRFDENLALALPEDWLNSLGMEYCELIEVDKESRTDRDKQYAEGIKRTGLSGKKTAGADFDGASSVTHPMLAKGCVDFASRAIKELFPANGPVKTSIIGRQTDDKLDKAERKKTYMNWQLTQQIQEHRAELEKVLSQTPLGGAQYKRWWHDAAMGRNRTAAVYIDDIFLPYDQNDFYTTPRLTHREFIGEYEFNSRVASKLYRDISNVGGSGIDPNRSEADKAAREVEGVDDSAAVYTKNGGTREVYTVYANLEIDDDRLTKGKMSPYIVHIEEYSSKVLGVYRNWEEDDKLMRKLDWIVEYVFIPWRGAYGIGLAQLIGSMAVAATGAINALLDSAHINNFPGGLKLKGLRSAGQTITVNATELREIDAPPGVDDIRKLVMGFPFNGPSQVLYNLVEWLTQQAEVVVSTASEKIADAGANMPMGTAMALIEGGSTNFSAIHARMHHSTRKELEILHRLNKTYLNDQEVIDELGELVVYRQDFQGPVDVAPVSDPNIFSEAQRYAQLQAVMQLAGTPQFANFFKPGKLLMRALKLLQVSYADDIANLPGDPMRMPPVEENAAACSDEDVELKVYEDQDDLMHLQSHVIFMTSPIYGASPLIGTIALQKLLKHCREHLVNLYRKNHKAAADALMAVSQMRGLQITIEQAESQGHAFADQLLAQHLSQSIAPGLQQAQQLATQMQPKPPADGNTQAQINASTQLAQSKLQAEQQQFQAKLQAEQATAAAERQFKLQVAQLELQSKERMAAADRALTLQTAQLTAKLEQMQTMMEHHIANLTLDAEAQRTNLVEQNKILLQEMQTESAQTIAVLTGLLRQISDATAAAGEEGKQVEQPDVTEVIRPLIEGIERNTDAVTEHLSSQQAMDRVADGMESLGQAVSGE